MRLAGQAKLGFYPAPPEALTELCKHLKLAEITEERRLKGDAINILDPCAGEGMAIKQIAETLAVPGPQTWTVELDAGRTQKIKENIPGVNLLGPATFLGVQITGFSFGLAYVNPPFDNELGGGRREELAFVERATHLLVAKGILALVVPKSAIVGGRDFCKYLDANYEESAVYLFPPDHRRFNEFVFIGKKRKQPLPGEAVYQVGNLHKIGINQSWNFRDENLPALGQLQPVTWNSGGYPSYDRETDLRVWEVPASWKPHTWKKTAYTEEELHEAVDRSPLNRVLLEIPELPIARPPLPLDRGHLGLVLASGMLNGVVNGPHGPHVVRGSSTKMEFHNQEASKVTEDAETGAVTQKDVFSERLVTVIRVVTPNGTLKTFSSAPKEKEAEDDEEDLF